MKRLLLFLALCLPLTACAAPSPAAAAPQPTPQAEAPALPEALMEALLAAGEPCGEEGVACEVEAAALAQVLARFGWEGRAEALAGFHKEDRLLLRRDTLYRAEAFPLDGREAQYAAILCNGLREGLCLVLEDRGAGWDFFGCFACGELPGPQACDWPQPSMRALSLDTRRDGRMTWLIVPGYVDSGSGRAAYDETWFNLVTGRVDLRRMTRCLRAMDPPIRYDVTSDLLPMRDEAGELMLELTYHGRVSATLAENWDAQANDPGDVLIELVEQHVWNGSGFACVNRAQEKRLSHVARIGAQRLIDVLDAAFLAAGEQDAAGAQWAEAVRQCAREEAAAGVTVSGQTGAAWVPSAAPRPEASGQSGPTLCCAQGEALSLAFPGLAPDIAYRLTRYAPDGSAQPVPMRDFRFAAQPGPGLMFYTLEAEWYFGRYAYAFSVLCGDEAAPPEETPAPHAQALSLLHAVTGWDFSGASSSLQWSTPEELHVLFEPEQGDIKASVQFTREGTVNGMALYPAHARADAAASPIPLAPAPEGVPARSGPREVARYWYAALPTPKTAPEREAVVKERDNPDRLPGRSLTTVTLRFEDGSAFTCRIDQATARLVEFHFYPA